MFRNWALSKRLQRRWTRLSIISGPSFTCEIVHYLKHKIIIVEPLNNATLLTHIYYRYMKTNYAELTSFDLPQLKSVDIKSKIKINCDETQQTGWFRCNLFDLYRKQTATVSPTASRFRKDGVLLCRVQWQVFLLNYVINIVCFLLGNSSASDLYMPKENTLYSEHGESLKSRIRHKSSNFTKA